MILNILSALCMVLAILSFTAYGDIRYKYKKLKEAHDEKWEFLNRLGIASSGEFHRIDYYVNKMTEQLNLCKYRNMQYKRMVKHNALQYERVCGELKSYEDKWLEICTLCDQAIREEITAEQLANDIIAIIGANTND